MGWPDLEQSGQSWSDERTGAVEQRLSKLPEITGGQGSNIAALCRSAYEFSSGARQGAGKNTRLITGPGQYERGSRDKQ